MSPLRMSKKSAAVAAGLVSTTLFLWMLRSSAPEAKPPAGPPVVVAAPIEAPSPTARATVDQLVNAPAAPADQSVRAKKQAMAATGESARIAERNRKLAELDWNAPRPGPPATDDHHLNKREAAISAADRLEQTRRMIAVLEERLSRVPPELGPNGDPGEALVPPALLRARLEQRVAQLEKTAQSLGDEVRAGGSDSPSGAVGEPERPR